MAANVRQRSSSTAPGTRIPPTIDGERDGPSIHDSRGIPREEPRNGTSTSEWDAYLLLAVILCHVALAPFTKVEESFNTQAMHDLLFHGTDLHKYDHFEFPGVVPRSFLGAMSVAAVSSPLVFLLKILGATKLTSLYAVRATLGFIVWLSFLVLRRSVRSYLGPTTAMFFCLICCLQFHLPFYSSRPLPNTFALALTNVGLSFWLRGKPRNVLMCLVFGMVVFRCDLLILLGPVGLALLLTRSISFVDAFLTCAATAILSLGVSVSVDSVMWGRVLWPEGEVLFFNTALNKSSEWGVSPFHWYFSSALPRSLLGALPLSVVGLILEPRVRPMALSALLFVVIYSNLPHKELRFIFPSIPAFNLAASCALSRMFQNRRKRGWGFILLISSCMLAASAAATVLFAIASYANYPGGVALEMVHTVGERFPGYSHRNVSVHIGVLPAMTGVSRFSERNAEWSYSKKEGISAREFRKVYNFTYLLSDKKKIPGYKCVAVSPGFPRFVLKPLEKNQTNWLPDSTKRFIRIPNLVQKPAVHILLREGISEELEREWDVVVDKRGLDFACSS